MMRLLWHARQAARRLGAMGLAGLMLLWAAGAGYALLLRPAETGRAADQAQLARLIHRPRLSTLHAPVLMAPRLLPSLPQVSDIPALLKTLSSLAGQHDVSLPQGQYTLRAIANSSLLRLELRLPVRADYPALRAFLAASLAALPSLALDGFAFKRADIGATQVDAELRLSFYLRPNP